MKTNRLRIVLRDVAPAVERTVDVPASATLPELHDLLQAAMGWTDSHLHQFLTPDAVYAIPIEDGWGEEIDERIIRLRDLPEAFVYLYDLGDSWEHDVTVLGRGRDRPGCPDGRGACPPEDCGGPHGYTELRAALADPTHPEHAAMRTWPGGRLREFDPAATDLRVRQTAGAVPGSVRLLLDLTAGGVKLTPGGRLPRALVRQIQDQRPRWYPLGRPASVEEDLPPLAVLHDLLRRTGLLRLAKGVVSPTRAAADDTDSIRRLRSAFSPGTFDDLLTTLSVAHLAAHGPCTSDDLAAALHPLLDPRWVRADGDPLTVSDIRMALSREAALLQALDLVEIGWPTWSPGPSAGTLLPRATALAALWSQAAAPEPSDAAPPRSSS